jgi:hypothetical protein
MVKTFRALSALAVIGLVAGGCDLVTEPTPLEEFQWVAVENPDEVAEGVDVASFFGDVSLLGQLKTPTLCYKLESSFDKSGSALTMRVDAKSNDSPNCAQSAGGFRYTAVLRHLGTGSYTLRVIHSVTGASPKEYVTAVSIK